MSTLDVRPFRFAGLAAILAASFAMGCSASTDAPAGGDAEPTEDSSNAIVNVEHTPIERQSIGNCWVYAHATWLESMHKRATHEDFDSSQSWVTYWDWFDKIQDGDIGEEGVETGGSWQLANNIVRRFGIVAEKDFVPEDGNNEMSYRQSDALEAIKESLESGALKTSAARSNKKLVLAELNKAWQLKPAVVAYMTKAFGDDGGKTFAASSGTASSTGTPIVRPQDFKVAYPSRDTRGTVTIKNTTLSAAMNGWREISYGWGDRRGTLIKVQRALHSVAPVVISWRVDFNAMEKSPQSPLRGSFNLTTLNAAGAAGREGGHLTVLEDYQVKLKSGEVLAVNKDVTDANKLAAALDPSATIEFLQIKNSWGAARPDREFAPGMPGYHNLYMDYMNGPITWCRDGEGTGTPAERGCTMSVTPLQSFVVPPGFDR